MSDRQQEKTVHVVAANYADDPHPHVDAVYDNEDAAEDHKQAITNSISPSGPVAWTTYEMGVRSDVDECPICGSEDFHHRSRPRTLDDDRRCKECRTVVP